jgi:hypothetical protein
VPWKIRSSNTPPTSRIDFTERCRQEIELRHRLTLPSLGQPLRLGPDHLSRMKIGVTEQTVVKRFRRALLNKGQYLHVADSRKQRRWGFGRYYLLDTNGVIDKDVNIERLARQLGVVLPRKTLEK